MKEELVRNDLVDALNSTLYAIEGFFDEMGHMDSFGLSSASNLARIGDTLVKDAYKSLDSFCELISKIFGDITVIHPSQNYDDITLAVGFEVKFSKFIQEISQQEEFPSHVEIIKQFDLGRREYIYRVNKKPSSPELREEGKADLHNEIAQG
jgi:hypothetical protein